MKSDFAVVVGRVANEESYPTNCLKCLASHLLQEALSSSDRFVP